MTSEQKERIEGRLNKLIARQNYFTEQGYHSWAQYAGSEIEGTADTLKDLGYVVVVTGENDLAASPDGAIIAYRKVKIVKQEEWLC